MFTIGYEASDISTFVATLHGHGIRTLVDVRELPLSRKRGFSKAALSENLESDGISYLHFRGLGDPKAGRNAAKAGDYGKFREIYGAHFETSGSQREFEQLLDVANTSRTCILCFEKCSIQCHRSIIAKSAQKRGFEIVNLVSGEMLQRVQIDREIISYDHRESLSAAE